MKQLEDLSLEHLRELRQASGKLLRGYITGDGLRFCPLCKAAYNRDP